MLIHSPYELSMQLRNRRKKLNLTQKKVGDLVGLKQKTISAIENNPETIKISTLFRILAALETDIKLTPKNEPSKNKNQWNDEW